MTIVGIGTDIIECLRIAQMIERHGDVFLRRVFTNYEVNHCSSRKQATQHYAARWAAKEAVLRALGTDWRSTIDWRDIEIRSKSEGGHTVTLAGEVREICVRKQIHELHVSLAYCRTHATAYVIAVGQ